MSQILIGYIAEGPTDIRFLESIIERTFIEVAVECPKQVEVLTPIISIRKEVGLSFEDQFLTSSTNAYENGVMAFCIHIDSDDNNDQNVFTTKIRPVMKTINNNSDNDAICKNIVPLVPVQMTEAWMLADKFLLKEEIGTNLSDDELGINKHPESFGDPKAAISEAIRIAKSNLVKRRRNELTISELYLPIGQKIELKYLDVLPSFTKFKEAVREAYRYLKYLP